MKLEELLALEWSDRTLAEYDRLIAEYDLGTAKRYLQVSHQIDSRSEPARLLEASLGSFYEFKSSRKPVSIAHVQIAAIGGQALSRREYKEAIGSFLLANLNPQALPMSLRELDFALIQQGFQISNQTMRTWLDEFIDQGLLKKLPNPYNGRNYVYCNADFREDPEIGDRVIELMRRRGSRIGTVTKFKKYRGKGAIEGIEYPVVRWEYSVRTQKPLMSPFESFANPEAIVVIERPQIDSIRRAS